MSFRSRLLVFFTIIVVIPMIAVALVLFALTQDSERGKADARLAGGVRTALALYEQRRDEARRELRRIAADDELSRALTQGDPRMAARQIEALAETGEVTSIELYAPNGDRLAGAARGASVATATATPTTTGGKRLGTLAVSVTSAGELARETAQLTGLEIRVLRGDKLRATTIRQARDSAAQSGNVDLAGVEYRARVQEIREGVGPPTRVQVLQDASELSSSISKTRLLIGGILLAFLVLSLASTVFVVRALQGQIGNFLQAARRLGSGNFGEPVPVQGDDEFAALGQEFNTMAEQLEAQIAEIESKRRELEESIRRIGEAFGAGLDRQGLVDLAVRTAVEACDARAGRLLPVDPRDLEEVRLVHEPELLKAIEVAEKQVFSDRENAGPIRASVADAYALSMPLLARRGGEGDVETIGAISIARRGPDFTSEQRDLFAYLTSQAATSIENADLHRRIQRQAITDELTGLSNVRHFHELLDTEIERAQRFNNHIGLVMVDIDNFKQVNDTYGHPQGDLVLKEIARVIQEQSRDIDFPARYGGEEMSVILPQTDIAGAAMLAERMREAIEELEVRRLDGEGVLKMTASFGVAALPATATDKRYLIAAADEALYKAKHGGKNRVERAEVTPEASPGAR